MLQFKYHPVPAASAAERPPESWPPAASGPVPWPDLKTTGRPIPKPEDRFRPPEWSTTTAWSSRRSSFAAVVQAKVSYDPINHVLKRALEPEVPIYTGKPLKTPPGKCPRHRCSLPVRCTPPQNLVAHIAAPARRTPPANPPRLADQLHLERPSLGRSWASRSGPLASRFPPSLLSVLVTVVTVIPWEDLYFPHG